MSAASLIVILVLIIPLIHGGKVCHDYGFVAVINQSEKCVSTCSKVNDQCPSETKCCYRLEQPCGFHCVNAKDDIKKAGQCPTKNVSEKDWFLCDASFCDVDHDCPGMKKCCPNSCGSKVCLTRQ